MVVSHPTPRFCFMDADPDAMAITKPDNYCHGAEGGYLIVFLLALANVEPRHLPTEISDWASADSRRSSHPCGALLTAIDEWPWPRQDAVALCRAPSG